jgi:hypothetical protein
MRTSDLAPWGIGAVTAALLFAPVIPFALKVVAALGVGGVATWLGRKLADAPDHEALEEERRWTAQRLLDEALTGEGAGHALHLRAEDGADDAIEGMLAEALAGRDVAVLGVSARHPSPAGPQAPRSVDWHQVVPRLMDRARVIVLTPLDRPGLRWELTALRSRGLLDRVVLRMPPAPDTLDAANRWEQTRRDLLADGIHLPPYNPAGRWFTLDADDRGPGPGAAYVYGNDLEDSILTMLGGRLPAPRLVAAYREARVA